MIQGTVNDEHEAVIRLVVIGPKGQRRRIEAVVDTGFNGHLSLPASLIKKLSLPWRRRAIAELADGSQTIVDIYRGVVVWNGRRRRIPIDEAETAPLVGMALLAGSELKIQVWPAGNVSIQRRTR
jgi:clan AA aspartic protease